MELTDTIMTRMDGHIEHHEDSANVIQMMLQSALDPLPLQDHLDQTLILLFYLPWLPIQQKAAIFLLDSKSNELVLRSEKGLGQKVLELCSRVPVGKCLCGQAAADQKIIYAMSHDHRHEIHFDGMCRHSHCCVPIISSQKVLGVLNLYMSENKMFSEGDERFILSVASILASIIERKYLDDKVKLAKEKAEASNRAKSEFLANMSHEIRTPMNAIIGLGHLLHKSELNPKQRDYINKIMFASRSLMGIINDILDLSKIEAQKMQLEAIDFELDSVLSNVAGLIAPKAQEKGVEFILSVAPEVPNQLVGDSLRLSQVLVNLTGNAVKFTEAGEIVIAVEPVYVARNFASLRFSIRDTGIGLTSEQISRLFMAFSQADASTTRKHGGTGLGLTICERLVGMMGGRISVDSVFGSGSIFSFTAAFGRPPLVGGDELTPPMEFPALRVLVVDGNHTSRGILTGYCTSWCFMVTATQNCAEALAALEQTRHGGAAPYDLVIVDWKTLGAGAAESVWRIRRLDGLGKVPRLLVLTTVSLHQEALELESLQVDAVLGKPFTLYQLLESLRGVFQCGEGASLCRAPGAGAGSSREHALREKILGGRVLVADDNSINQQVAQELLQDMGLQVTLANNGAEVVARVVDGREVFELIFMDLQMPVMDGIDATLVLKTRLGDRCPPIVAMTAHAMVEERERCMQVGMVDHVAKPIELEALYTCLEKWIKVDPGRRVLPQEPKASSKGTFELPDHLPGIDVMAALQRVRGNKKLLAGLLVNFSSDHESTASTVCDLVKSGDLSGAKRLVHTVRGVAGNISAKDLFAVATELEQILAEASKPRPDDLLLKFKILLAQVVKTGRFLKVLSEAEAQSEAGQDDLPLDMERIEPLVQELKAMLLAQNMGAKKRFETLRPLLRGKRFATELEQLTTYMSKLNFHEAFQRLAIIDQRLRNPMGDR